MHLPFTTQTAGHVVLWGVRGNGADTASAAVLCPDQQTVRTVGLQQEEPPSGEVINIGGIADKSQSKSKTVGARSEIIQGIKVTNRECLT